MATQKTKPNTNTVRGTGGNGRGYAEIKFINVNLSDAQKSAYSQWENSSPDWLQLEDDVLAAGYKLSGSFDEKSLSYLATLTNRNGDPAFINSCFTLRARSAGQARARVLWLHSVYAGGDWREFADPHLDSDVW